MQVAALWCSAVRLDSPQPWSVHTQLDYPWNHAALMPKGEDAGGEAARQWFVQRLSAPTLAIHVVENAARPEPGQPPFREVLAEEVAEAGEDGAAMAVKMAEASDAVAQVGVELSAWHERLQQECAGSPDPNAYGQGLIKELVELRLGAPLSLDPGPNDMPWVKVYNEGDPIFVSRELPMFPLWAEVRGGG